MIEKPSTDKVRVQQRVLSSVPEWYDVYMSQILDEDR